MMSEASITQIRFDWPLVKIEVPKPIQSVMSSLTVSMRSRSLEAS